VRGLKWGLLPMFKKKRLNAIILIFSMWLALAKLGGGGGGGGALPPCFSPPE
jgi:hypothetical protein